MNEPIIAKKGPYIIEVQENKSYYWCKCGKSNKQPFCDSSHKGTPFKPIVYKATNNKRIYFCGCKKTNHPPFCDNTHKKL